MRLVTFTETSGKTIYINPDHVVAVQPWGREGASYIFTTASSANGEHSSFIVNIDPSQVAALLEG